MGSASSPRRLSAVVIAAIEWYQRYLSPRKGFGCAYRIAYGRCSCSHYGKRIVQRAGVWTFVPLMHRRFARCANAAAMLRANEIRARRIKSSPLQYREAAACNPDSDALCCFAIEISPYILEAFASCY